MFKFLRLDVHDAVISAFGRIYRVKWVLPFWSTYLHCAVTSLWVQVFTNVVARLISRNGALLP